MSELYPGYIVKANGEKGKITAVNINSVVVQLSNRKATFKREDIEVIDATPYSDVKTYTADQIKTCEDCGKPKLLEEFPKLKGGKRRNMCSTCFGFRISQGHQSNRIAKPKPRPKQVASVKPVEEIKTAEDIKTVEEWVEKNLNKENNAVVKPSHYIGTNGLEVKQILEEFVKDKSGMVAHRWCSAVEYLLRAYEKNGKEDLEKAIMNIEWLIKEAE